MENRPAAAVHATTVFASPAALANVLETKDALDQVQRKTLEGVSLMLSAGAPIPEPLLAKVQELVPQAKVHTPYGMTEALPVTDIDLPGIRTAGQGNGVCVGTAVAGATVAIAPIDPRPHWRYRFGLSTNFVDRIACSHGGRLVEITLARP